jgi:hypothetical protein
LKFWQEVAGCATRDARRGKHATTITSAWKIVECFARTWKTVDYRSRSHARDIAMRGCTMHARSRRAINIRQEQEMTERNTVIR